MRKIIIDILPCGMCNQLFMYAYGVYVKNRLGSGEIYLDYSRCRDMDHSATWERCLSKFELDANAILDKRQLRKTIGITKYGLVKLIQKWRSFIKYGRIEYGFKGRFVKQLGFIFNSDGALHREEQYYQNLPEQEFLWCSGYFQNPDIVNNVKEILRKTVVLKEEFLPNDENYKTLFDQIHSHDSIALHIRRGDYIGHNIMGGVCTDQYYLQAIQRMCAQVKDARIFVFSDDIEYAKKLLSQALIIDAVFVSGPWQDYEELMLMRSCKHFIISNSSFSYMGQLLSENNEKVVISPSRWYSSDKVGENNLAEKSWILL